MEKFIIALRFIPLLIIIRSAVIIISIKLLPTVLLYSRSAIEERVHNISGQTCTFVLQNDSQYV